MNMNSQYQLLLQEDTAQTEHTAIGNCLQEPCVYLIGEKTRQEEFIKFIQLLESKLRVGPKPYLILDNHSAHKTQASVNAMRFNFKTIRIPKYSCQFNSIEHLFGVIKQYFRKLLLDHCIQNRKQDLNDLYNCVRLTMYSVDQNLADSMLNSNRKYIQELLM